MQPLSTFQKFSTFYLRWLVLNGRGSSHRRQSQGMAQLVVMLLMLTILTTSLAIASRVTAGLFSQTLQSRLRLAKDAAEYGLTITVHELNKSGNRLFLGTDWTSDSNKGWTNVYGTGATPMYRSDVIPTDANQGQDLVRYPCYIYADENPKNRIYRPTSQAANLHATSQPLQYYSGNSQSFRLLSMQLYSGDHQTRLNMAPSNAISYLALTMEGTYNSSVNSSNSDFTSNTTNADLSKDVKYTIQQEYEVIPRCCHTSFGNVGGISYGTDTTTSDSNNCPWNIQTVWMIRSITRTANFEGRA